MPAPVKGSALRAGLHPRNRYAAPYDFARLVGISPELAPFVRPGPAGRGTIDFADPAAVIALNRALLESEYGIVGWTIPPGYLCPPIPGRADYLHHLADLLAGGTGVIPRGPAVVVLDIGVGANCVYPLIGASEYGWRFVGSEVDEGAVGSARRIVVANPQLAGRIDLRRQRTAAAIFRGVVRPGERFAASICNPPFHASAAAAAAGTRRKLRNLGLGPGRETVRNFGGRAAELWCPGGERAFVRRMIVESAAEPARCRWFTTLVSSRDSLPGLHQALKTVRAVEVRIIPLAHGQKQSRIVAWRFGPG